MLPVIAVLLASLCHLAIESVEGSETSTRAIRGFADLNFEIDDAEGSDSRFRIGEYDTYITGTLAPGTSFLSEVTYNYREEWIIGLRRLWVRHTFKDYLRVSVGKFHTPLGYWNRAISPRSPPLHLGRQTSLPGDDSRSYARGLFHGKGNRLGPILLRVDDWQWNRLQPRGRQ